ncbi:MAG: tRNA 2-thiouridine(34) synthase MnmA [Candidatus Omnitrophica bacterium]|nr:tRNA 2-thiouridine(34) synthase MnmA [Candidatus Omnitrophota bacterium]
MTKGKVLVAMSGGVDSSMAVCLLIEKGYEVSGATMRLWDETDCGELGAQSCCSLRGIEDARAVADKIGISHFVIDLSARFGETVINYFRDEYLRGRTPNPCIVCNERIKFGLFLERAQSMGFDYIATGHYARLLEADGEFTLNVARDKKKDQSYFLFLLTQDVMKRLLFPCGGLTKAELREKAKALRLPVSDKEESQEICFIPDNNYARFLKERFNVSEKKGFIKNRDGEILGAHNGFFNFTVGQRRRIGLAHSRPLYVIALNSERNEVIVGEKPEVLGQSFEVELLHWISAKEARKSLYADVKIRSNHKASRAQVTVQADGRAEVKFDKPEEAITPGQAAVFYDSERVLGGGWIK